MQTSGDVSGARTSLVPSCDSHERPSCKSCRAAHKHDAQSRRSSTFSDGRAITARSPTNTTGRCITSGCCEQHVDHLLARRARRPSVMPERLELRRRRCAPAPAARRGSRRGCARASRGRAACRGSARRRGSTPRSSRISSAPATSSTTGCERSCTSLHARRTLPPRPSAGGTRRAATSTAPSERRCGVVHCTSNSSAPSSRSSSTVAQHATFDASVTRWNIDSPANRPPMRTPYSPPASSPSRHASTLCAQPSSCSRVYASTNVSSIQPCGRRGSAHAAHHRRRTRVSTRISKRGRSRAAASGSRGTRRAG